MSHKSVRQTLPPELRVFFDYVYDLQYSEEPDYAALKTLLKRQLRKCEIANPRSTGLQRER